MSLAARLLDHRTLDETMRLLGAIDRETFLLNPQPGSSPGECPFCLDNFSENNPPVFPNCQAVTDLINSNTNPNDVNWKIRSIATHPPIHAQCLKAHARATTTLNECHDKSLLIQDHSLEGRCYHPYEGEVSKKINDIVNQALRQNPSDAEILQIVPNANKPSNPIPPQRAVGGHRNWNISLWRVGSILALVSAFSLLLNQIACGGANIALSVLGAPAALILSAFLAFIRLVIEQL